MALTPSEVIALVAKVRRLMPRNADVMVLCEELERRVSEVAAPGRWRTVDGRFDKRAYQRDLMRKRRAAEKSQC